MKAQVTIIEVYDVHSPDTDEAEKAIAQLDSVGLVEARKHASVDYVDHQMKVIWDL